MLSQPFERQQLFAHHQQITPRQKPPHPRPEALLKDIAQAA
jgi:hypothetical protein